MGPQIRVLELRRVPNYRPYLSVEPAEHARACHRRIGLHAQNTRSSRLIRLGGLAARTVPCTAVEARNARFVWLLGREVRRLRSRALAIVVDELDLADLLRAPTRHLSQHRISYNFCGNKLKRENIIEHESPVLTDSEDPEMADLW